MPISANSLGRRALLLLVTAVFVLACLGPEAGATARVQASGTGVALSASAHERAIHLIGLWRVLRAHEPSGTTLVLGGRGGTEDLLLLRPCGELEGSWAASNDGKLVGMIYGASQGCHLSARWLGKVTGFKRDHRRIRLTDRTGTTLAVLRPEQSIPARVKPDPKHSTPVTRPTVTKRTRKDLAAPAPLPSGIKPALPSDLIGRWAAAGHPKPDDGFVRFQRDDDWTGSDGCNGYGGRYTIGRGGRLLILDGPNGAVACAGTPAPGWVAYDTARIGLAADGRLLLFNRHGHHVGTLTPKR